MPKPPATLISKYKAAMSHCWLLPATHISLAKVENVVNEPQKPVTSRAITEGDNHSWR